MTLIKTLVFTIIVPGTVTVAIPHYLLPSDYPFRADLLSFFQYPGLALILFGGGFYFRCAYDFIFKGKGTPAPVDPPKELVINGLYGFVRNPMYVGIISILIGESIIFAEIDLLLYALLVLTIFHLVIILYEEPTLKKTFGESYIQYCKAVPRWFPLKLPDLFSKDRK
jgi:protein-S-isoprenylcysteine O-methyltransferase Ste14